MIHRFQSGNQIFQLNLERRGDIFTIALDGQTFEAEILDEQPGQLSLRFEDRPVTLYWAEDGGRKWISLQGCTYLLEKPAARLGRLPGEMNPSESVRAPMPGQVRAIEVVAHDQVSKGQTLLLLEAMKMEIRITAPRAGSIAKVLVGAGQTVDRDQLLIEFDTEQARDRPAQDQENHDG